MTMKICWIYLLILVMLAKAIQAETIADDASAITNVSSQWKNPPRNWVGSDPCGSQWIGINCSNSYITSITLTNYGLTGTLSGDIQYLVQLWSLDLSYNPGLSGPLPPAIGNMRKLKNLIVVGCSFSGQIPPEIGKLQSLTFLGLNANNFSGTIPSTFGNLSSLTWFDITENNITGPLPISDGNNLGLDMLTRAKHFHFGKNKLSGELPAKLFHSEMQLLHVLFDNNNFSGTIPSTLGLVTSLQAVRLDWNKLTGRVPSSLNNLTNMAELLLSNNHLQGLLPNLTGMNNLAYVDLSNNSFEVSQVPAWFSTLPLLTTLILENLLVQGQVPSSLFSTPLLETVRLRNNLLDGTLTIGSEYSSQLHLIDLPYNRIDKFNISGKFSQSIQLTGNPACNQNVGDTFCKPLQQSAPSYTTPIPNCPKVCPSDQQLSPSCECGYPLKGIILFRLQAMSNLQNFTYFRIIEAKLMVAFVENQLPLQSVSLQNPYTDSENYLRISLAFFPSNKTRFELVEVIGIGHVFSTQTFKGPSFLGPYYFIAEPYPFYPEPSSKSNKGIIIGASVGGGALVIVLIGLIFIITRQKRKLKKVVEQSKGSGSWDPTKTSGSFPQFTGPRWFSFEELKKCTNNFSEANDIGSGGYGKVYKGKLPDGQLVAVKRAEQASMQGGLEYKTEIGLLSRIHHKNLVTLVGFCSDQGEQMLVYEYVPNGSLRESLSGKSGIRLDWKKRLHIALGAARGLTYLHELCDPPIVHRDIKSNNILLDNHLNARVADFGLSKLLSVEKGSHVTTQVKGTMGYLDPEYYMTQQLTEKSDVYSFGVVLLELITARKPLERGRYIVRQIRGAMDKQKDFYNLERFIDSALGPASGLGGFQEFVNLAMSCLQDSGEDRPTMTEVTKEIESIVQIVGLNPNMDSGSPSASYSGTSRTRSHPYSNEALSAYTGDFIPR